MPTEGQNDWKVISKSIRGPSHERLSLPNQDHFGVSNGEVLIVAVSDGHGSAKCFRSHWGSEFAVDATIDVFRRFFAGDWSGTSVADRKRVIESRIPIELTRAWQEKVSAHHALLPFTTQELERLEANDGAEAIRRINENPSVAYGATIIAVVISNEMQVYLQNGDGDVLIVDDYGCVSRPVAGDERLFANETTSLSSKTAWNDFRGTVKPTPHNLPTLVLIGTDGYSNSFKDDASFLKAGTDFLELLRSEGGVDDVQNHLEEWLSESSRMSGDDVTLCLLYRRSDDTAHSSSACKGVESTVECVSARMTDTEPIPISEPRIELYLSSEIDRQSEGPQVDSVDVQTFPKSAQNGDHSHS